MSGESCVYLQDKDNGWLPAHVLKQDGDVVNVRVFSVDETETVGERAISLKDYPNGALPFQNVDASGNLMEMADMVDLPSLHEAAILYNLRTRHLDHKPYTRVGDLIVAVNPFKVLYSMLCCRCVVSTWRDLLICFVSQWMKELYSEETRSQYVDKLIWNGESRRYEED
jgi:myosin-5